MKKLVAMMITALFLCSLAGSQTFVFADEAQSSADPQNTQRLTIEEAGV